MAGCLGENTLADFIGGRLGGEQAARVEEHVDGCSSCFRMLAQAARTMDTSEARRVVAAAGHVPLQIDEYRLLRPIGRGAVGQVYLALDTRLDRRVAIKFLAVERSAAARERFLVEARAVARLSHPNVVAIYRVGEVGEHPYLVGEFVRGRSLDLVDKPLPWRRALEIARGLARGLAAAHAAGVLHRDIKPANAILGKDGSVKLLDFGLAKLAEQGTRAGPDGDSSLDEGLAAEPVPASSPSLTNTGALLGTPLYMAPEAWRAAVPTASMDVYALGAVVHELCTGERVHAGTTLDEIRGSALESVPSPLATCVPGIDPGFAAAIDRTLRKDPGARYESAEQLCAELDAAVVRAEAPPPVARKRPRRLRLAALAALVVAALAAVVLASFLHAPARPARPAPLRDASTGPVRLALAVGGLGDDNVEGALIDARGHLLLVGHAGAPFDLRGVHVAPVNGSVMFGFVADLDPDREVVWVRVLDTTRDTRATGLAVLPGGDLVVAGAYSGGPLGLPVPRPPRRAGAFQAYVARLAGGDGSVRWVRTCDSDGDCLMRDVAVAPDGRIAVTGELHGVATFSSARTWDVGAGLSAQPFVAVYTPDGELAWASAGEGADVARMHSVVFAGGDVFASGNVEGALRFAGRDLTTRKADAIIVRLDGAQGELRWARVLGDSETDGASDLASDASGRLVAGGNFTGTLDLGNGLRATSQGGSSDAWVAELDPETGQARWLTAAHGPEYDEVRALAIRPDGGVVVVGRYAGGLQLGALELRSHGSVADVFVIELDSRGGLRGGVGYGGDQVDHARNVSLAPSGQTVLSGRFRFGIDFGSFHLDARGNGDGFVVLLDPSLPRPGE